MLILVISPVFGRNIHAFKCACCYVSCPKLCVLLCSENLYLFPTLEGDSVITALISLMRHIVGILILSSISLNLFLYVSVFF